MEIQMEVKWIKLTVNMFDNRKIKYLRKLPDGDSIVLIWVMLLTMAGRCNASGMIFLTENVPYTPKMLADELDFEENTVRLALEALERMNMVVTNGDFFSIAGWEEYQSLDKLSEIREYNRLAKRRQRERQKLLPNVNDKSMTSQPCQDTDIEEEKEIDIDIEKEKKSEKKRETTHTLFERLISDYNISDLLQAKMSEWFKYKTERKEPYKEQGMKALLTKVENSAYKYGDQAICNLIDDCMANNWKGIIFDRLTESKPKLSNSTDDFMAQLQSMYTKE
jgi:predicted phage replisome organizer